MDNIFLLPFLFGVVVSCLASYILIWRNTLRLNKRFISEVTKLEKEIQEQIRIIGKHDLKKTRAGRILLRELEIRVNKDETKLSKLQFTLNEIVSLNKLRMDTADANWLKRETQYSVGDIVKVKILSVTEFGAIAELEPGIEGLIHKSKMIWGGAGVSDPNQIVKVGELIDVSIDKINLEERQISLSMLKAEEYIQSKYRVGEKRTGTIKKIVGLGLIVELEPGVVGFVHIMHISSNFLSKEELERQFRIGDEVKVVILKNYVDSRRIELSIKQA